MSPSTRPVPPGSVDDVSPTFAVGQRVFFWTGRGSSGYGTIRALDQGKAFIDPEPGAIRGSDARGSKWGPRDYGVRLDQLNTEPQPWFENN